MLGLGTILGIVAVVLLVLAAVPHHAYTLNLSAAAAACLVTAHLLGGAG